MPIAQRTRAQSQLRGASVPVGSASSRPLAAAARKKPTPKKIAVSTKVKKEITVKKPILSAATAAAVAVTAASKKTTPKKTIVKAEPKTRARTSAKKEPVKKREKQEGEVEVCALSPRTIKPKARQNVVERAIGAADAHAVPTATVDGMLDLLQQVAVDQTSFTGTTLNAFAGLFHFVKTYRHACAVLSLEHTEDDAWRYGLQWFCHYEKQDKCDRHLHVPHNFLRAFRSCSRSKRVRFVFGLITLYESESGSKRVDGHENAFLYDTQDDSVEIFEPNGKDLGTFFDSAQYNKALADFFLKTVGVSKVYSSDDFCPVLSFQRVQTQEASSSGGVKLITDPEGFCTAWSLWWIEFRLRNAASISTRAQLVAQALDQLKKNASTLTAFIRSYGEAIVRIRNEVLRGVYERLETSRDKATHASLQKYIEGRRCGLQDASLIPLERIFEADLLAELRKALKEHA